MLKDAILKEIDKNSKVTAADLASMTGTTEAEVVKAIAEMEADGIICGYPTLINWDKTDNSTAWPWL